jgi:hypothetical protein
VNWQLEGRSGFLNLYIRGTDGGYVEMRVDERTGALAELVVIESPPGTARRCSVPGGSKSVGTLVLDREMWQWRVTPDYVEPVKRDVSIPQRLAWLVEDDMVSLQFGEPQASSFVSSGDAEFGISESGELVCMAVRTPDVAVPPDYPDYPG